MRVEFSSEARTRLQEIDGYYCDRNAETASRFLLEAEKLADTISNFPDAGIRYRRKYRLFPMSAFPYIFICEPYKELVLIVTIIHKSRDPKRRLRRIK